MNQATPNEDDEDDFVDVTESFYPDGKLHTSVELKDDLPHGIGETYFPSGNIESETTYRKGLIHGSVRRWNDDGTELFDWSFRDGLPHGECVAWNEKGSLWYRTGYEKGEPHGPFIENVYSWDKLKLDHSIEGYHFLGRRLGKGFQTQASFTWPDFAVWKVVLNVLLLAALVIGIVWRPGLVAGLYFLAPIIWIHELGHFWAARWMGIPIKIFRIGIGPSLFAFLHSGTRYELGLLPLGGYVQAMPCRTHDDLERYHQTDQLVANRQPVPESILQLQKSDKPFRSSHEIVPAWRQVVFLVAGVMFNLILGVILLWAYIAFVPSMQIDVNNKKQTIYARNLQDAESINLINQNAKAVSEGRPKVELDRLHYKRTIEIWNRKPIDQAKPVFTRIGDDILQGNVFQVLRFGIIINIALFVLNLLPVPPFDGYQIVRSLIPQRLTTHGNPWPSRIVGFLTILVLLYLLVDFLYAMYLEVF